MMVANHLLNRLANAWIFAILNSLQVIHSYVAVAIVIITCIVVYDEYS